MKQSPIFVKTYDLMAWLIPRTLAFPKSQRGVLARQIQARTFELYELLVDAGMSSNPQPLLHQADGALTKLRTYLRLMSIGQYNHASRLVAEVGRLLGGWLKSVAVPAG